MKKFKISRLYSVQNLCFRHEQREQGNCIQRPDTDTFFSLFLRTFRLALQTFFIKIAVCDNDIYEEKVSFPRLTCAVEITLRKLERREFCKRACLSGRECQENVYK